MSRTLQIREPVAKEALLGTKFDLGNQVVTREFAKLKTQTSTKSLNWGKF